ncbi:MAG: hypothetical protein QM796_03625 [Chthoniobacteraceae bacterium]
MMDDARFSQLLERCLDREASAEERAELQTWLREEPTARARFWEAVEWQALFRQWGEQEWGRVAAEEERRAMPMPLAMRAALTPARQKNRKTVRSDKIIPFPALSWAIGIAAAVVAMMFLTAKAPVHAPLPVAIAKPAIETVLIATPTPAVALIPANVPLVTPPPIAPVAIIAQEEGAVWNSENFTPGARLRPGRLQLERGVVLIAFNRGAHVVLEGPADFEIRDDNSSVLRAGRLRAHVPVSAHGFKVETPQFTAVDLGTEFGCDLGSDGVGELHVFTGKVDWQAAEGKSAVVELNANQALRIENGLATRIAAQPLSFLSESDLARRAMQEKGDWLSAWRLASRQLELHPATVLHFDFENASGATLPNRAPRAAMISNAMIHGGKLVDGRWPGKGAMSFRNWGDRLEFALPGMYPSLTFVAWVQVRDLHVGFNPLIMTRSLQAGQVNWFIHRDGGLGISVAEAKVPAPAQNFLHTQPVIGPQNFGTWVMVACVLDGPSGIATLYLNGVKVGSRPGFVHGPFTLTNAEVGNSLGHDSNIPGESRPNLDGSIDELAIFSTTLPARQIARLYQQGRPHAGED